MSRVPSYAIGEVEALVLKAYRGAGFSWGMAQEAGKAASWLTANQLPALDAFAILLNQIGSHSHHKLAPAINSDDWPALWSSPSSVLCPVIAGALISDMGLQIVPEKSTVTMVSVAAPLILLPFVATLGVTVIVRGTGLEISICGDAIDISSASDALTKKCDVVLEMAPRHLVSRTDNVSATERGGKVRAKRGFGKAASIQLLENLAYRTYVPATQASRESGAGAGLTDDD